MKIDIVKHLCIIGETQSGKTVLANEIYKATPEKCLFIDIEDLGEIQADIELDSSNSRKEFVSAIKNFNRIKFIPSPEPKQAQKEVRWIWNILSVMNINICVFVDETQNYGNDKTNAFDIYAVRGLKRGIHLVSISQRPAYVSKTIMAQTPVIVFFNVGTFEKKYFTSYQLPYDEMVDVFATAPEYSFIIFERGKPIRGPFKLSGIK